MGPLKMSPAELKLISVHSEVEIEPLTFIPKLNLLEKEYGPYFPLSSAVVPFFCAKILSDNNLCVMKGPTIEQLKFILEEETKNEEEYFKLPNYFFELSSEFIKSAEKNNREPELYKKLYCDIREIRFKKIRDGLEEIDCKALLLDNVTGFEFNQIKKKLL